MLKLLIAWFALLLLVLDKVAALSTTTSSSVPTHTISVGAGGLEFTPKEFSANVSDVIGMRLRESSLHDGNCMVYGQWTTKY